MTPMAVITAEVVKTISNVMVFQCKIGDVRFMYNCTPTCS